MTKIFRKLLNMSFAAISNALLTFIAICIALCGIGLTTLYLIKYVDNNAPEMKVLQCAVGIPRDDCIDYKKAFDDLKAKRQTLEGELAALKRKLHNLSLIAENTDSITLFDTTAIPDTALEITVGTVYKDLLSSSLQPEYFCYIRLPEHNGVSRNLYIRNYDSDITLEHSNLLKAGVSTDALAFARTKCTPYLIHEGA